MTSAIRNDVAALGPFVDRVIELAERPQEEFKKKLRADHQALRPTPRSPVCAYYEGIPGPQWKWMFGEDFLACRDPLVEGRLTVFPSYRHMGYAPFDVATRMRGMEALLLDAIMAPDKALALMDFITSAMQSHEERREKEGRINTYHHVGTLFEKAQGHPMDLNISDIHSFDNDPAQLTQWAQLAREEAERFGA